MEIRNTENEAAEYGKFVLRVPFSFLPFYSVFNDFTGFISAALMD